MEGNESTHAHARLQKLVGSRGESAFTIKDRRLLSKNLSRNSAVHCRPLFHVAHELYIIHEGSILTLIIYSICFSILQCLKNVSQSMRHTTNNFHHNAMNADCVYNVVKIEYFEFRMHNVDCIH